ncbi:MAG: patatin family protein [Lachnospiraceae bacterium]|nr:patatin family protein [Lachnospiraceae bacterium]
MKQTETELNAAIAALPERDWLYENKPGVTVKPSEVVRGGLVVEGGGMKGVYTAGVMDVLAEERIFFSDNYGVSAGACNLVSHCAGQKGRACRVFSNYLEYKDYCSLHSLVTTGDLFGKEMVYDRIPNRLDPFDYESYRAYPGNVYAVVTNLLTGKAEYKKIKDLRRDMDALRASASLPLVSNIVYVDGLPYLDGGCSDSIPVIRSLRDGNKKTVVIMTKEVGYVRKPSSNVGLIRAKYHRYPGLVRDMARRHVMYNKTVKFIEEHEKKGHIFVIRPQEKSNVGRIEKDQRKLRLLYEEGYEEARRVMPQLKEYLGLC